MTALNATVAASLASIATINDEIARLTQAAKSARSLAMDPFLDALAKSGEVSLIVIYGWTPGFNDGEPCEHGYEVAVNIEGLMEDRGVDSFEDFGVELPDEMLNGLANPRSYRNGAWHVDQAVLANNLDLCKKHGHVYHQPSDEIMSAINQVVVDTIEEEQGTDYYVSFVLKDGKFERVEGDYDCGY